MQVGTTSCTKTKTITDTDTVNITKTDTLTVTDTVRTDTILSVQILTANSWKLEEERGVDGNNILYYVRGGSSNTESFDNEYITFNATGTGTYVDPNGGTSTLTWNFTDSTYTSIVYLVQFPSLPTTITWNNLVYKNKSISYDEYFTQSGVNCQNEAIRIVK